MEKLMEQEALMEQQDQKVRNGSSYSQSHRVHVFLLRAHRPPLRLPRLIVAYK